MRNPSRDVRDGPVALSVRRPRPLVELYPALTGNRRGSAILETRGPEGMTVLAWDPAVSVRLADGSVEIRSDPAVELPTGPPDRTGVPGFLARLIAQYAADPAETAPRMPPFVGGLVGFVGYEWAAAQEGPDSARPTGIPDIWFGLFDKVLVQQPGIGLQLIVNPSVRGTVPEAVRRQLSRSAAYSIPSDRPVRTPQPFRGSWSRRGFEGAVRSVRQRIRRGDVYQANLAVQFRGPGIEPWPFYLGLRHRNPSPFGGFLEGGGLTIASASPERLLRVTGRPGVPRTVETRPIAGTRPRAPGPQDARNERALRRSPKERAEHTMLVDLGRNDLGRVSELGSVEVDEWLTVERYSHVMHLVSNVRSRLAHGIDLSSLFRALMPGGSVTGTPKIRATEIIAELEPVPRGAYTGSMGYVSFGGQMDFNLLIRSAFFPATRPEILVYAGAGIVLDSRPEREWREVQAKAAVLLETAMGAPARGFPWGPPHRYSSWKPPTPARRHTDRDVLLIDNYDSFTYNLAQYLSMLGARVRVVRNDAVSLSELRSWGPSHVVLSPGPGRPHESGITVPAVRAFEGTPLLGVCLGHQAIIEAYGGSIGVSRRPMHGKTSWVECTGRPEDVGLLADLAPAFRATRYHSLVARDVPASLKVTARAEDGEVMAVQHRELPTHGVQFHPESLRTSGGISVLDRFLSEEAVRK